MKENAISRIRAFVLFGGFTAYFYLLLFSLLPWLKSSFALHPAVYWFVTGYALFAPLLLCAVVLSWTEGNRTLADLAASLRLRPLSVRDWKYVGVGLGCCFAGTGVVFLVSHLFHRFFGIGLIDTTPWFMEMRPFAGAERLFLLVWLPMFFLNIVGEELLWRGYIQARLKGGSTWLLCAAGWMLFHLPFGPSLMVMLIPIVLFVPYAFSRTSNASVGIVIHGIYNGPIFVALALGLG